MKTAAFIALLRGVNMGGHNRLAMADLRALAENLGFSGARTLLQSGNLVFAAAAAPQRLEAKLETALRDRFGLKTAVFVHSAADWAELIAANPFARQAASDPGHLALMLLKDKPAATAAAVLKQAAAGREIFRIQDQALYAYFPDGFVNTKLTTALLDRTLATVTTARSWNTVLKIAQALDAA